MVAPFLAPGLSIGTMEVCCLSTTVSVGLTFNKVRLRFFLFGFHETFAVVSVALVGNFCLGKSEREIAVKAHFTCVAQLTHFSSFSPTGELTRK